MKRIRHHWHVNPDLIFSFWKEYGRRSPYNVFINKNTNLRPWELKPGCLGCISTSLTMWDRLTLLNPDQTLAAHIFVMHFLDGRLKMSPILNYRIHHPVRSYILHTWLGCQLYRTRTKQRHQIVRDTSKLKRNTTRKDKAWSSCKSVVFCCIEVSSKPSFTNKPPPH
jgi:hypothetical protein